MTPGRASIPKLSAALAGIPAGIQAFGPWCGRRQLSVKFADEAETATIYTADGLRSELLRLSKRSAYHSVAIVGPDALAEQEFLCAALGHCPLPVMLDHDGQRPESLGGLIKSLALVQVTMDGREAGVSVERAMATLARAADKQVAHAVVILPGEGSSDAPLLRIVEQVHAASASAQVVVHPVSDRASERDRRWVLWLEQAMAAHADVRVIPRAAPVSSSLVSGPAPAMSR